MKKTFLFIATIAVQLIANSQSLNIGETIYYINKLLGENQYSFYGSGYGGNVNVKSSISLDIQGFLKIEDLITVDKGSIKYTDTVYYLINVADVNQDASGIAIDLKSDPARVSISCSDGLNCIAAKTDFGNQRFDEFHWNIPDIYNAKRLFNALKYFIAIAYEQGYKRNDSDDPFVDKPNSKTPKTTTKNNSTAKKEYKVYLKENGGVFMLNANVNGQQFSFILDSGAGECNISSDTEKSLLSKGLIKQNNYLSNGLYQLANGSIVECKRVRIPKITVGGKTIFNVTASIGPKGSPNLLGQSFLNKTAQWTINNDEKCLVLR